MLHDVFKIFLRVRFLIEQHFYSYGKRSFLLNFSLVEGLRTQTWTFMCAPYCPACISPESQLLQIEKVLHPLTRELKRAKLCSILFCVYCVFYIVITYIRMFWDSWRQVYTTTCYQWSLICTTPFVTHSLIYTKSNIFPNHIHFIHGWKLFV